MELLQQYVASVRRAVRQLRRTPAFTVLALLSLALGVGATTAMVALVDAVLLRPVAVRDPGSLVLVAPAGTPPGGEAGPQRWSYPFFRELRDRTASPDSPLAGVLAFFRFSANAAAGEEPQRITAELVSGSYFEVLGVAAAVGRTIGPEDDAGPGGHPVAVLSHAYWQRAFAGDRAVVGKTLVVNGQPVTVIGVSAAPFTGLELDFQPDVRMPMAMASRVAPFPWIGLEQDRMRWAQVFARLRPGVSPRQAEAALQPFYAGWIDRALAGPFAGSDAAELAAFRRSALVVEPGAAGTSYLRRDWSTPLLAMSALAGLLLLLTAVNVAGLFIGRGVERRGELALRLSLGASRGRVVRELIVESALLVAVGGVVGIWLAPIAAELVVPFLPIAEGVPSVAPALSGPVLGATIALLAVVALVSGVLPAWLATRVDLAGLIGQTSSRVLPRGRVRQTLVAAEITLSLLLVFASGLFVRSLRELAAVRPGFETDTVVAFGIDPTLSGHTRARVEDVYARVKAGLDATPGIDSSAMGLVRLLAPLDVWAVGVAVEGTPSAGAANTAPQVNAISPDYFRTLGIVLRAGRDLRPADDGAAAPVVIVNEAFVRQHIVNGPVIGRRVMLMDGRQRAATIVGIVADSHTGSLRGAPPAQVFVPYTQFFTTAGMHGFVRSQMPVDSVADAIRRVVAAVDPSQPIYTMRRMSEQRDHSLSTERVSAGLASTFGVLATLLAVVGLFGALSYSITRRTRELGLRLALGAPRARIAGLVIGELATLCALGVLPALPIAYVGSRLIANRLYGIGVADPWVIAIAAGVVAMAALAAAAVPLRRVTQIDPAVALRRD
jgi:predicted permease